jgi:hypothetical protein
MVVLAVVAGMTWMLGLALKAQDAIGAWIVAGTMAAMIVGGRVYVWRRPDGSLRALMLSLAAMTGAIIIAILNWRMYEWFGALADGQTDALRNHLPRWAVNVFMLVIVAVVMGITAASTNEQTPNAARAEAKQIAGRAAASPGDDDPPL